jgi:hypothetical protein
VSSTKQAGFSVSHNPIRPPSSSPPGERQALLCSAKLTRQYPVRLVSSQSSSHAFRMATFPHAQALNLGMARFLLPRPSATASPSKQSYSMPAVSSDARSMFLVAMERNTRDSFNHPLSNNTWSRQPKCPLRSPCSWHRCTRHTTFPIG